MLVSATVLPTISITIPTTLLYSICCILWFSPIIQIAIRIQTIICIIVWIPCAFVPISVSNSSIITLVLDVSGSGTKTLLFLLLLRSRHAVLIAAFLRIVLVGRASIGPFWRPSVDSRARRASSTKI